jgi:replicative DNA helicase
MMEKLMPQNIEAEEAVLGSALIDPEIVQVLRWLQPSDFYRDAHRQMWQAMQTLARRRTPPDEITLCDALQREGKLEDVGGACYISNLVNSVPTSAHAEYYAAIIARMAIARRAVHAAGQIAALAYNELNLDTLEFRRKCMDLILKATQDHSRSRAAPLSDILRALQEETYNRMEGDLEAHLLLPGFHELDRMLVGLERGDMIYLAARPRMGKSGLAQAMLLHMARQLARTGGTCDYVTLEMTSMQQARRMVASESQINSTLIRAGFRDVVKGRRDEVDTDLFSRFTQAVERLREEVGDVVYVQEEGLTVEQLRDHLAEVVTTRDCRLVVVDQLDLFAGPGGRETEQEHVSAISKALKQIAKDLQIVVLCLVQLNRNLESRVGVQGKRPQLADLRMSGRLEMDADMVLFLHRPCVYEPGLPLVHYEQYTEVWAGKVREGEAGGMVPLCFTGRYATFSDWPKGWQRPALEQDPEGEQAWAARLERLQEERSA